MANGPCPSLPGRHYINGCWAAAAVAASRCHIWNSLCGQCHPNAYGVAVARLTAEISYQKLSPWHRRRRHPFCYRYAVHHRPWTFMNDWLLITWHWRRWIINVAVICTRWDPMRYNVPTAGNYGTSVNHVRSVISFTPNNAWLARIKVYAVLNKKNLFTRRLRLQNWLT